MERLREIDLRNIFRDSKSIEDFTILFDYIYDIRDSCEENMKRFVNIFLRTYEPSLKECEDFSLMRLLLCSRHSKDYYVSTFLWLTILNARSVMNCNNKVYDCCIGVESLLAIRSHVQDLMAHTWNY